MFSRYYSNTLPVEHWDKLCGDSLLDSRAWLALWESIGGKACFFLPDKERADLPKSAFSSVRFGSGFWSRLQAHVDGLPASLLAQQGTEFSAKSSAKLRDEVFEAIQRTGRAKAVWIDYDNSFPSTNLSPGWTVTPAETQRINLTDSAFTLPDTTRRHIRSGAERGASLQKIENAAQVEACYQLMVKTFNRFNRKRKYSLEFFRRLFKLSQVDSRILWYVCVVEDKTIGSHISLVETNYAISWLPFIDREFIRYKPAYLMMSKLIETARSKHLSHINLGGSPEDAEGLKEFKAKFGAAPYSYQIFSYSAGWTKMFFGSAR